MRGTWFPLTQPSAAARQELREAVKVLTGRDRARRPTSDVITEVNRVVQGWGGYFHFRHCTAAFSALNEFVCDRVRIYLSRVAHGEPLRVTHGEPMWDVTGSLASRGSALSVTPLRAASAAGGW